MKDGPVFQVPNREGFRPRDEIALGTPNLGHPKFGSRLIRVRPGRAEAASRSAVRRQTPARSSAFAMRWTMRSG